MRRGRVSKNNLRVRRSRRLAGMIKMLSATGSSTSGERSGGTSPMTADNAIHDFLTTGRTGRRNALPDILGEHASESTADLPERLEALTCSSGTQEVESKASSTAGQSSQVLHNSQQTAQGTGTSGSNAKTNNS